MIQKRSWMVGMLLALLAGEYGCYRSEPAPTPTVEAAATALAAPAEEPPPAAPGREGWLGVYLGEQKVGFSHWREFPTTYNGREALAVEATEMVNFAMMGQQAEQSIIVTQVCDPDFTPREMTVTLQSGGRTTAIRADFTPHEVQCQIITQQATTSKTVPIPPGVRLVADENSLLLKEDLQVGETVEFYVFNPITLTVDKLKLETLGREAVTIHGQTYQTCKGTLHLRMMDAIIPATVWVDETGEMVKMQTLLNLTYLKEPQEKAMDVPTERSALVDLALATSIRPDVPLENFRQCRRLRLRIQGLRDPERLPQDERQQVILHPADGSLELLTTASEFPASESVSLPIPRERWAEFLKAGPYVEADHPDILKQAQEIVGSEKNAYRAALKISQWVHDRIQVQFNIGIFRSALDILHDPAGVCRDAAVLYTALARAAGIPTRVCAGLVYLRGVFMGHAWAESWVGRWVPFDPTRPGPFVDATHLKFAQGEYTAMFEVLRAMGTTQIQVLEQDARPPASP
jgi:transglutaminase-like putative cysteine protease